MNETTSWPPYTLATNFLTSRIPDHCEPTNSFFAFVSSVLGSCTPTPLAFLSTLLGTLSIISWLFAQLPQVIKNYRLQSTSGLSIYFLVEWCLGDLSNLFGALLTKQATWQIIIGCYYCFVDIMLVSQWVWYEKLKHGRPLRSMLLSRFKKPPSTPPPPDDAMQQFLRPRPSFTDSIPATTPSSPQSVATDIPTSKTDSSTSRIFRDPVYGSSPMSAYEAASSLSRSHNGSATNLLHPGRGTARRYPRAELPSPSPRTILFITLLIALTAHASPVPSTSPPPRPSFLDVLGTVLSWTSTTLYLCSRLPQLVKNYRLRSTSGLSPLLFGAAFCGNLFYSTSMLANPQAWSSFPAWGERGWVRGEPSAREDWVLGALPFFLGAAGVLIMDAAVGLQFWLYAPAQDTAVIVVSDVDTAAGDRPVRYRRVSGWMRGWQPGVGGAISPVGASRAGPGAEEERRRLLAARGEGYGALA